MLIAQAVSVRGIELSAMQMTTPSPIFLSGIFFRTSNAEHIDLSGSAVVLISIG
jgi:hypothetical protein